MVSSLLLVDDEELFHLVFEDACSILDIAISTESINSTDEVDVLFKNYFRGDNFNLRPECIFVDLNMVGSTFNGIELIRRINFEYGNNVVIGIISSSNESEEIEKAKSAGAMFWIVKTHDIEFRLERFKEDYHNIKAGKIGFRLYD